MSQSKLDTQKYAMVSSMKTLPSSMKLIKQNSKSFKVNKSTKSLFCQPNVVRHSICEQYDDPRSKKEQLIYEQLGEEVDSKLLYESCVSPWDELDPIGQFVESSQVQEKKESQSPIRQHTHDPPVRQNLIKKKLSLFDSNKPNLTLPSSQPKEYLSQSASFKSFILQSLERNLQKKTEMTTSYLNATLNQKMNTTSSSKFKKYLVNNDQPLINNMNHLSQLAQIQLDNLSKRNFYNISNIPSEQNINMTQQTTESGARVKLNRKRVSQIKLVLPAPIPTTQNTMNTNRVFFDEEQQKLKSKIKNLMLRKNFHHKLSKNKEKLRIFRNQIKIDL